MDYGRALRIVRAARGLSQKDVAAHANIEPSYLSLLEAGKRTNPSAQRLERIAAALDIPLDLLMLLATESSDHAGVTADEASRIGQAMLDLLSPRKAAR